jgi:hypothetical protein
MAGTLIAAQCPRCLQITEQTSAAFLLYRCTDQRNGDFYTFTCEPCGHAAAKPADVQVAALLIASLVRVVRVTTPLELADVQRQAQRPVGWDDVLDFISELQAWDGGVDRGVDRSSEGAAATGA